MLRAFFGAALVLRLLVDMATPLMPGAFRFDPAESVEAHRVHFVRGVDHGVVRPTGAPQLRIEDIVEPRADIPLVAALDARAPRFRPLLARHTLDSSPEAAEDH